VTLIEIVAGLVVLAVLVSAVLMARGRLMRQWSESERKLSATAAADRMIAGWVGGENADSIPVPASGRLEGVEGCFWRTNWISQPMAARVGAGVVRLEVFEGERRVLSVDLLKHLATRADRGER
jgi:hypothetical protein